MNLYAILLAIYVVASISLCIRQWVAIKRKRNAAPWLTVPGVIDESIPKNPSGNLLPLITYRFEVNGASHTQPLEFPPGTEAMPEFATRFLDEYPKGKAVNVYYDPNDIEKSALEPVKHKDDWMIFSLGVASTIMGIFFLFFTN